jgi:hypothetical protein
MQWDEELKDISTTDPYPMIQGNPAALLCYITIGSDLRQTIQPWTISDLTMTTIKMIYNMICNMKTVGQEMMKMMKRFFKTEL